MAKGNSVNDIINNREETAKSAYDRLSSDRNMYETRAEDCAKYTIPSLFPESGANASTTFSTPYQSFGARAVNNLTSKLALALMPPNSPFFILNPSQEAKQDLANSSEEMVTEVQQQLMRIENIIMKYVETHQIRVTVTEALKMLIVSGNACLYLPPEQGGIKMYNLRSYVVKRDALGKWYRLITLDKVAWASLPEDVQNLVGQTGDSQEHKPDDEIEIYTDVQLVNGQYVSYQEVNGEVIDGTEQLFPEDSAPWIPLRMVKMDGESYGRSFVEEYLGDLRSLENLSKAIVNLSSICASVYFLVNPNGITRVSKLAKADTGAFVAGRAEDITVLQLEKYNDLNVASQTAANIESRLSYAFLLNSAVQRNGERVTAEEIRYVAGELEDTLGGIYSILAQELQLPLVKRLIAQLESNSTIPDLPDDLVDLEVTTGVEALGRGHDLNKLAQFLELQQNNPVAAEYLNWSKIMIMEATALGIDTEELIKSDEQLQQEQQQQTMQDMATRAAPQMAKGMMDAQQQQNSGQGGA